MSKTKTYTSTIAMVEDLTDDGEFVEELREQIARSSNRRQRRALAAKRFDRWVWLVNDNRRRQEVREE